MYVNFISGSFAFYCMYLINIYTPIHSETEAIFHIVTETLYIINRHNSNGHEYHAVPTQN